jgi:hypothetical protein
MGAPRDRSQRRGPLGVDHRHIAEPNTSRLPSIMSVRAHASTRWFKIQVARANRFALLT